MKKEDILKVITYFVIVAFMLIFISQENYEFIGYNIEAVLLFWLVLYIYKKYNMPFYTLVGFSIWLFLHMLGGTDILGNRVYGVMLFQIIGDPFYILRYDQLIHFYCYVIVGSIFYFIIKRTSNKINFIVLATAVLAATGVGALNEIFEFSMVVFLENSGVGNIYNNSLDLIFNLLGAITGVYFANKHSKR